MVCSNTENSFSVDFWLFKSFLCPLMVFNTYNLHFTLFLLWQAQAINQLNSSHTLSRYKSSKSMLEVVFAKFLTTEVCTTKRVHQTLDLFALPRFTKPIKSDPAKRSHKAGYQLSKLTQVFLIYTWACSHKRGSVSSICMTNQQHGLCCLVAAERCQYRICSGYRIGSGCSALSDYVTNLQST